MFNFFTRLNSNFDILDCIEDDLLKSEDIESEKDFQFPINPHCGENQKFSDLIQKLQG